MVCHFTKYKYLQNLILNLKVSIILLRTYWKYLYSWNIQTGVDIRTVNRISDLYHPRAISYNKDKCYFRRRHDVKMCSPALTLTIFCPIRLSWWRKSIFDTQNEKDQVEIPIVQWDLREDILSSLSVVFDEFLGNLTSKDVIFCITGKSKQSKLSKWSIEFFFCVLSH